MSTRNSAGKSNGNGTTQFIPVTSQSELTESRSSSSAKSMSQDDLTAILQLLTQIREQLPTLRDLTAEERRSMLGMGNRNRTFAGKVLEVIQQTPDFLPRSFDIEQYQQDLATFDRLSSTILALTQLRDLVDSTAIALGSDIYEEALIAYRHAKASGQGASLDAAMAEMKQRFTPKSKKKDEKKPDAE